MTNPLREKEKAPQVVPVTPAKSGEPRAALDEEGKDRG